MRSAVAVLILSLCVLTPAFAGPSKAELQAQIDSLKRQNAVQASLLRQNGGNARAIGQLKSDSRQEASVASQARSDASRERRDNAEEVQRAAEAAQRAEDAATRANENIKLAGIAAFSTLGTGLLTLLGLVVVHRKADSAYREANTVNLKIAEIGVKMKDDKPLNPGEAPRAPH